MLVKKLFLRLWCVFGFISALQMVKSSKSGSPFLIYRQLSENNGFCLTAEREMVQLKEVFRPVLSTQCLVNHLAWKWLRLEGGLLKNVLYSKCLTAELGSSTGTTPTGKLDLEPCDPELATQQWTCGSQHRLLLQNLENGKSYSLGNELVLTNWQVTSGTLILSANLESRNTTDLRKWIIYSVTEASRALAVCESFSVVDESTHLIETSAGGEVVGEPCVFPFIRNGVEVWQCVSHNSLHICATTRNLDRHPNSWGVCPENKRGTYSEPTGPYFCSKPCGGGRVCRKRKCLFPPCVDVPCLSDVCDGGDTSCSGQTCNTYPCTGDTVLTIDGNSQQFPADGIMTLLKLGPVSKCAFPYILDGEVKEKCVVDFRRDIAWCSLTENYDKHQKWGYCLDRYQGAWTTWSIYQNSCSRTCGSGRLTLFRRCRFPPCTDSERKTGGVCNTKPCPECFNGNGADYRGSASFANDGTVCQMWNEQSPHAHSDTSPDTYPELVENYCRNPGGLMKQPYCYRNSNNDPDKMYCDIPRCGVNVTLPGIPYSVPVRDDSYSAKPCVFPFKFRDEWHDRCTLTDEFLVGREKCAITSAPNPEYRYCPAFYRGKWSEWKYPGDCTANCGGGYEIGYRVCYLTPCDGKPVQILKSKPCNTHPCTWTQPGRSDCFNGRGVLYNGTINTVISLSPCENWRGVYKAMIEAAGLSTHNYCRNPNPSVRAGPWCYARGDQTWQYCNVPRCPTKEGEIFAIPYRYKALNATSVPCVFPFVGAGGQAFGHCTKINPRRPNALKYCGFQKANSLTPTVSGLNTIQQALLGLQRGIFGVCPKSTEGTWTSWVTTGRCSVVCGGGSVVMRHRCLHPPCTTGTSKSDGTRPCNTQDCLSCLQGNGRLYRGDVKQSANGNACLPWSTHQSSQSLFPQSEYPELQENFCRNPGGQTVLPWCYTNTNMWKSYCELPHCSDDSLHTIPYTIPSMRKSRTGDPCHFPFRYKSDWYFSCFLHEDTGVTECLCPMTDDVSDDVRTLAVAPKLYRGKWTVWNKTLTCSKMCGGGETLYVRECLYPSCVGSKFKFEGPCNTHECSFSKTLVENVDCFIGEGLGYTGEVSVTLSGRNCQQWSVKSPHTHRYIASGSGIELSGAICRNPSPYGKRKGPWCFVDDIEVRWEYCNIPRCPAHEGEIVTFDGPDDNKVCKFPFTVNGVEHNECIPRKITHISESGAQTESEVHYCATSWNLETQSTEMQGSKWGICPSAVVGTISAWTLWSEPCTAVCNGGRFRYKKHCRYPPCKVEVTEKYDGTCNTQPCPECYNTGGTKYRGTYNRFPDVPCLKWNDARVPKTEFTNPGDLGDSDHSFCRNPIPGRYKAPFCYISYEGELSLRICDIPRCNMSEDRLVTVGSPRGFDQEGKYCTFPYLFRGTTHHSCVMYRNQYMCGTHRGQYGYCSKWDQGVWGAWTTTRVCTKVCGGGTIVYARRCRYEPCRGVRRKTAGTCNSQACNKHTTCYDVISKGREFIGKNPFFSEGRPCLPWGVNGHSNGGVCQNPHGAKPRPYCNLSPQANGDGFAYCAVPACPDLNQPIMVDVGNEQHRLKRYPCVFPFISRGVSYSQCTNAQTPSTRNPTSSFWCGTVHNVDDFADTEWGYCDNEAKGTFSQWSSVGRKCTSACVYFLNRTCLYPPCEKRDWKLSTEICDGDSCVKPTWTGWSKWTTCRSCVIVQTRTRNCRISGGLINQRNKCKGHSFQTQKCASPDASCDTNYAAGHLTKEKIISMQVAYNKIKNIGNSAFCAKLHCNILFFCFAAWLFQIT